jgi:hypothetical protein
MTEGALAAEVPEHLPRKHDRGEVSSLQLSLKEDRLIHDS